MSFGDGLALPEKRRHPRAPVLYSGTVHQDGVSCDVVVTDLSAGGACLLAERPLTLDRGLILDVDELGLFAGQLVWREANRAGMMFLHEPETIADHLAEARRPAP